MQSATGMRLVAFIVAATVTGTSAPPKQVDVLSFNVMFDSTKTGASLDAIDQASADIVCLQELTPAFASAFQSRFGARYPHRAFFPRAGTWGVGIASRFPLARAALFPQRPHRMPGVEAHVLVPGHELVVSCVHLFPPFAKRHPGSAWQTWSANAHLRAAQARALVMRYARSSLPVLLLGDFNEGDDQVISLLKAASFADACAAKAASCGSTWPGSTSWLPAIKQIDHVTGRGVVFQEAHVLHAGGSDHFPIQASFVFESQRRR